MQVRAKELPQPRVTVKLKTPPFSLIGRGSKNKSVPAK